jgi:hypothetical protein
MKIKHLQVSPQISKDGSYNVALTSPTQPGHYRVESHLRDSMAFTSIEVQHLFFTRTAYMLYIGGGIGFGAVIAVMVWPLTPLAAEPWSPSQKRLEALRFIFLSILAFTPIAAFALTDVQIAPNSPFGLIITRVEIGSGREKGRS